MLHKIKTLAVFTVFFILSACSDNVAEMPKFKIMEDTVKGNIKRTVEVELLERTNEESLHAIAEHIHGLSSADVQRTFIGYRVKGDHKNQGYWATTHYNPDLKVNILGASASDYGNIKNTNQPEGEILGTWMASWGYEYKMTAFKQDEQTFIKSAYSDGSSSNELYFLSQSKKGVKLQDQGGKERGEYFIINSKGDLEFWSQNGNYYTAPKL